MIDKNNNLGGERIYYESDLLWGSNPRENEVNRTNIIVANIPESVSTILDVGCGNGLLLNLLNENYPNRFDRLHGFDRSENALRFVKTEKSRGEISTLPFKDNEFDLVICSEVLEHLSLEVYDKAVKEIARVAAKYIIITVPYKEDLLKSQVVCPSCFTKFHLSLHVRTFDDRKMVDLFKGNDFGIQELTGIEASYYFYVITPIKRIIKYLFKIFKKKEETLIIHCPICGFSNLNYNSNSNYGGGNEVKGNSFMKENWPKKKKYLWFFGLYIYKNHDNTKVIA